MAKENIDIWIRARDLASKQMTKIGKASTGMSNMLKRAAAGMAIYFGGRAIIRGMQESLELFSIQEKSVKSLSDALGLLGQNSAGTMKDMKNFAASIQKVTVYGDEAVLELMAMGASMGNLSGKPLKDATKAAIGLATAYKMDVVAAMRLVARAGVGDTASLKRYGIVIDANKTAQEKFNDVLEIGINKFKLAEGETKTYAGAIKQMKNAVGDLKEEIGKALMPVFLESARKIKEWAEDNQKKIGEWAVKAVGFITKLKDGLWDFVTYLQVDFISATNFAMDSFLVLMKAAMESAVIMAVAGGKGIYTGIKEGLLGSDYEAELMGLQRKMIKEKFGTSMPENITPEESQNIRDEAMAELLKSRASKDSFFTDAIGASMSVWKKAFTDIRDNLPVFNKPGSTPDNQPDPDMLNQIPGLISALAGFGGDMGGGTIGGFAAQESRFLTRGTGQNVNDKIMTETARQTRQNQTIIALLQGINGNTHTRNQPKPITLTKPGQM